MCATLLWAATASGQTVAVRRASRPPDSLSAKTPVARSIKDIVGEDVGIAVHDALGYFTAPFSFDGDDWTRVAAGAGAVGAVMAVDEGLNNLMTRDGMPGFMETPVHWGEEWGRLRTMQYASLGMYVAGLISGSESVRITGRLMGEALVLAGLPAITLQYGLGRSRPLSGRGAWAYQYLEWRNENQSLPSGHSTVAFAISTVLAKRAGKVWGAVPLYGAAGLAALSLGWTNQHWPSDLLIGAALGYVAGSYVVSREEERSGGSPEGRTEHRRRLEAGIGPGGLTLIYRIY